MTEVRPVDPAKSEPSKPEQVSSPRWWRLLVAIVAVTGLGVFAWACLTQWGGVVHGHPAYAVVLALTAIGALLALWVVRRPRNGWRGWRRVLGILVLVLGVLWVAAAAWLRPLSAIGPALGAMESDAEVTVTESATRITMTPADPGQDATAVLFQPGAKVDPRAYAAVLRPLAEAGHLVVIAKPALGIAFFGVGDLDAAREDHAEIDRWVVGGHSLGGVVAAMEADDADADATAPVVGLLLYASYPASDMSSSLTAAVSSISASNDELSTPAKIEASRDDLPADADFTVIEGAVHAYFGDYGAQPGDGTPTISHDEARRQISEASVTFLSRL